MDYNIQPLEKEKWQDYPLMLHYYTDNYYDVKIENTNTGFNISLIKTTFEKRFEHIPNPEHDKLFAPYREDVKAWGVIENDKLVAIIETAVEEWSNRLVVSELQISESHRRKGLGTALMNIAKERAVSEKRRAIILETQTCNENAIAFYLSQGFSIIGFDACAYSNKDIEQKEVRLELGYFLD